MGWTRRRFLSSTGRLTAGAALLPRWWVDRPAARVAVVGAATLAGPGAAAGSAFARGALLGIEEAERSAALLRRELPLIWAPPPADGAADEWAGRLRDQGVVAVVSALGSEHQSEVEEAAAGRAGLVVMDARPERSSAAGHERLVRTGLPRAAYEAGLRLARSRSGDEAGLTDPIAVLWHHGLFRYGAEQLNERFRRRFDAGMDGEAWAAWMSVKALAETLLRNPSASGDALARALAGPRVAFDGHKGAPLAFTAPGRTLAQPFYVIGGSETVEVEWPSSGT